MTKYKIFLSKTAVSQLKSLEAKLINRIKTGIRNLEHDPFLRGSTADIKKIVSNKNPPLYRLRIGNYRIIFVVVGKEVRVTEIFHRSKGYKWLN